MKKLLFLLVSVVLLHVSLSQPSASIDCSPFKNCTECLYNSLPCGWCGTLGKCLQGNSTGPYSLVCPPKFSTDNTSDTNAWEFTWSQITLQQYDSGSKLSPSYVEVFLRPGVPLNVPIHLTVPLIPPIDFFFLLDASISMKPYISLIRKLIPQINANLTAIVKNSRLSANDTNPATIFFGMGSYIEKPVSPFACYPEAYILKVHTGLVNSSDAMQSALDTLLNRLAINYEHPENPLEAALLAAYDVGGSYTQKINWRPGSFHIVMICTDASAHVAGQGTTLGIFKPNNHDGVPDGFPPGSEEDYVDPIEFKKALIKLDITPLFGAIATSGVLQFYQDFSDSLGIGSWIPVSNNSQQVVSAILNGTLAVLAKAILAVQDDDLVRILQLLPNNGTYPTAVKPRDVLTFTVVMLASESDTANFGQIGFSVVKYAGFGDTVTIKSFTAIECKGCSVINPTYQIDLCGVCGGNNSVCTGCDGTVGYPVLQYDICGVCGGSNESCLDCLLKPVYPGANSTELDLCGVCGGDNSTCLGCDNIPNSGLVYNNCNPPVCGGPPCNNFTAAIVALAAIAVVGIVAAIVAVILLCGAGAAMANADAELIEKEANLHDNPLYEEAKRKFDNPLWSGDAPGGN